MKVTERGNELPIIEIKNYERNILKNDVLFTEQDKKDIPYVIHRMRRSKLDSELHDDRNYVYSENEGNNMKLKANQIEYIKTMASKLNLEYNFYDGIHYVYKFSLSGMFG